MANKNQDHPPLPRSDLDQNAFNQALQFHQTGRLPEAEKLYRTILATNPRHAQTLYLLGMIAFDCNHHQAAEELVRAAITEKKNDAAFHYLLGNILNARGKPEDAIASYKISLSLKPGTPDYLNNLGTTLLALKNDSEALSIFKTLLENNPQHFIALGNTASIL
ncbi:MAG: tetratricopeptide repeat protein, partial [Alphaproteobacteria bacterium]